MKNILLPIVLVAVLATSCKNDKPAKSTQEVVVVEDSIPTAPAVLLQGATHAADVAVSSLTWKGFKPGGLHNGTLTLKEGAVIADSTGIKQGVFVIDMTSLKVLDLPTDSEDNGKLAGHLASPDFFDVAAYPTANFKFTEFDGKNLKGDLTIKGISKPLSVPVKISEKDGVTTLTVAPFNIDRTQYDIKFKSKKFFDNLKDKFINDEFEVGFEVKLKKK
jgi:polyisoprenoid-binding protein YceI